MKVLDLYRKECAASPAYARVVPFVIFLIITILGGWLGGPFQYWFYALKVFVGAWLIWEMRAFVPEMRWAMSWEAVAVGIGVFVMWVGIDPYYPKINLFWVDTEESIWNPFKQYGEGSGFAWAFICIRIAGMTLVVPPLEEVFFRSLVYRYLIRYEFLAVPLNQLHWTALLVTSLIFASEHFQWLAGILCGLAYQWLVLRKNRLGDAMTAHGITNFLLGIYVYSTGDWKFW